MPAEFAPFGAFLVATSVGLGLALATFYVARKSGLAPVQTQLIETLQDNSTALSLRVAQLEDQINRETQQRVMLEQTVQRLRNTVADLAAENAELKRRLGLPPGAAL